MELRNATKTLKALNTDSHLDVQSETMMSPDGDTQTPCESRGCCRNTRTCRPLPSNTCTVLQQQGWDFIFVGKN